jgi:hypothetical protein
MDSNLHGHWMATEIERELAQQRRVRLQRLVPASNEALRRDQVDAGLRRVGTASPLRRAIAAISSGWNPQRRHAA